MSSPRNWSIRSAAGTATSTLLFAAVAERLGFAVRRRMARVQPRGSGLRTHMMLIVAAEDTDFLVDVGFGAGMWQPTPLVDGAWEVLHQFDDTPTRLVDYEVAHHYVSTHPRSPFVNQVVVMRLGEGLSRRLVGHVLTEEHADGRVRETCVEEDDMAEVLRELDVEPRPADLTRLIK